MGKHLGIAYNLRLPQELKDKIAESAKELNRSMNADIVARLEDSFEKTSIYNLDDIPLETLTAHIFKRLNKSGLHLTLEEVEKIKK